MTIGEKLKTLRKSHGYTQDFVSSELDITRQAYSHYETGRYMPNAEIMYKLAKLYSIPIESLIKLAVPLAAEDGIKPEQTKEQDLLASFIEYTSSPYQEKRLRYLNQQERLLIYYFNLLKKTDQQDIIDFLSIKAKRCSE